MKRTLNAFCFIMIIICPYFWTNHVLISKEECLMRGVIITPGWTELAVMLTPSACIN